jgi:hypothetical protein
MVPNEPQGLYAEGTKQATFFRKQVNRVQE